MTAALDPRKRPPPRPAGASGPPRAQSGDADRAARERRGEADRVYEEEGLGEQEGEPSRNAQIVGKGIELGGKATKAAGTATKAAGTATQAVGKTTQAVGMAGQAAGAATELAGKGVQAVGSGVSAVGKALTATKIGAIVGAPLMALGGAAKGAGKGVEGAGKGVKEAGKGVRKAGEKVDEAGKKTRETGERVKQKGEELKQTGQAVQQMTKEETGEAIPEPGRMPGDATDEEGRDPRRKPLWARSTEAERLPTEPLAGGGKTEGGRGGAFEGSQAGPSGRTKRPFEGMKRSPMERSRPATQPGKPIGDLPRRGGPKGEEAGGGDDIGEQLREDRVAALKQGPPAGGEKQGPVGRFFSRLRGRRGGPAAGKAVDENPRSRQAAGLMTIRMLYAGTTVTWGHTFYPIAIMYLCGYFSKFLRHFIPPMGTLLDPKATVDAQMGKKAKPHIGPRIGEYFLLSLGVIAVAMLDLFFFGMIVIVIYAIDEFCDITIIGKSCDIVAAIANFIF